MANPGSTSPIRFLPVLALAAALAACQPQAPLAGQDAATTGAPAAAGPFDGLAPGERINFQCNEVALGAAAADGDAVRLSYSGQRLELPAIDSATGTRYADDQGNEMLIKDDGSGVLVLSGEQRRDCVRSDRASPWDLAADNGVTYRAVGQEPGWLVEVTAGEGDESATLTAHLDYGQRLLEVLDLERDGEENFSGSTATGAQVELAIQERECVDTMSGERFRTAASLVVDGQQYEGCGSWLSAD